MNFQGEIVFLSGAITGIDGYRKIFAVAEQWLREQGRHREGISLSKV